MVGYPGDGGIERLDDFGHAPHVGLGIGQDDRIAGIIGADRRAVGEERAQVIDQFRHVRVADRQNLGHDVILAWDLAWDRLR